MTQTGQPEGFDAALLEESLEDLYDHAPCGYVSTFPDGTFAKVNQTFLDWTGYTRDDLIGRKRFQSILTVGGRIFYETHYAPLLHMQGFVNEVAFDLVCPDGQCLPVLINSVQKRDAAGVPLLHRTTIFNASDRREYERELLRARKQAEQAVHIRDTFFSVASHELRNPLTSLLGSAQLLQRRLLSEGALSERNQRTLAVIIEQADRLNKMIAEMLDVGRIASGQLAITRARLDITTLARRVVADAQSELVQHTLAYSDPGIPLVINGDASRLEQVLQNLIQNAIKYSPAGGPVALQVEPRGNMVCIAVADQGLGIAQDAIPHLFQRFYRAAQGIEGLGIGLYVVKEIVTLHGGSVTVESTEGAGSTFTVYLPLLGDEDSRDTA